MKRLLIACGLTLLACTAAIGTTEASAQARNVVAKVGDVAPPEAVARFLMGTRLGYITCSGKFRTYLEKKDLYTLVNEGQANPRMEQPSDEDARACVQETIPKGRDLYNEAARQATAPAARTALKEYMTAWEASLNALQSAQGEPLRAFEARYRKQDTRLDQLQARLESTAR